MEYRIVSRGVGVRRREETPACRGQPGCETIEVVEGASSKPQRVQRAIAAFGASASVTEAIYDADYGASIQFYETLVPKVGLKSTDFAAGSRGGIIHFTVGDCSLGCILVAATAKGVCAIELGDSPQALVTSLQGRFRDATLAGGEAGFEEIVAAAVRLTEDPSRGLGLPLNVWGTTFQLKVWEALREIEPGKTATYQEVAERAGVPGAIRAAAGAIAANKIAVAIPCHRVIRKSGALSGYRWGVARKAALLERERKGGREVCAFDVAGSCRWKRKQAVPPQ